MELNRLMELAKIVLEPATSHGNATFHVKMNGILVRTCLCDTGARTCVLPKKIADQIGIQAYKEMNELMTMIDETTTRPLGKVSNVGVEMDRYTVPTDFLVGIQAYEETNELMTMIYETTTRPHGKVSNVGVEMDCYTVPTEFVVVETESSYDVPVIMGRPFIASTGAIVDLVDRSVMFTKLGNIIATKRHIPPPDAIHVFSSPPPS